jgi:hypothetical protein
MLPDKDIGCHRTGFTRKCRELVAAGECNRFIQVQGMHPQTEERFSRWDCVDNWAPLLLIDNTRHQAQTCASIDRFNNEMVMLNGAAGAAQAHQAAAQIQGSARGFAGPQTISATSAPQIAAATSADIAAPLSALPIAPQG